MAKKHTVDEVIRSLSKKRDVKINPKDKTIEILDPAKNNDLGNGSWGKIDFLVNHSGYTKLFSKEFSHN